MQVHELLSSVATINIRSLRFNICLYTLTSNQHQMYQTARRNCPHKDPYISAATIDDTVATNNKLTRNIQRSMAQHPMPPS